MADTKKLNRVLKGREKERQHVAQRSEGVLRHSINELLRDLTEELAVKQPDQPIEMLSLQKSI